MHKPKKILIHYTHKGTLGHSTRIQRLCHELVKTHGPGVEVHILQGGLPQPCVQFPKETRLIPIPAPFDSRASFAIKHKIPQQEHLRSHFVLQMAQRIQPDIFLTEFFPFGRQDYTPELLPAIHYLHASGCRIYASIGYPCSVDLIDGQNKSLATTRAQIISLYDKLFIHTPENVENIYFQKTLPTKILRQQYLDFFKAIAGKTVYTGYIVPARPEQTRQRASLLPQKHGQHTVVVSRGGGAVYPGVIVNAIKAQQLLGDNFRFIIACGPSTSQAEHSLFQLALKKYPSTHTVLLHDIPDLPYFLQHASTSVSLCGYNTSVQLMRAGIPGIVIPFINPHSPLPSNEQTARALLLRDHAGSTILPYSQLTPTSLARAIHAACTCAKPTQKIPSCWFNGAANTVKLLLSKTRH